MNTKRQRIAIAQTQGIDICPWCYHVIDPDCCHCGSPMKSHGFVDGHSGVPRGCTCGYDKADVMKALEPECPDYLGDLNAMHEAEKVLIKMPEKRITYAHYLMNATSKDWAAFHATAAQRAEAFLRTLNLWKQ